MGEINKNQEKINKRTKDIKIIQKLWIRFESFE